VLVLDVDDNSPRAGKANSTPALLEALDGIGKAYLDNQMVRIAKRLTIERISGLNEDDFDVSTPTTPLPPSIRGGSKPTPVGRDDDDDDDDGNVEVDPDMELSEEEKKKLRVSPYYSYQQPQQPTTQKSAPGG